VYEVLIPSLTADGSAFFYGEGDNSSHLSEELYLIVGESVKQKHTKNIDLSSKLIIFDLQKNKIRRNVIKINYSPQRLNGDSPAASSSLMALLSSSDEPDWVVAAVNSHHSEKVRRSRKAKLLLWSTKLKRGFTICVVEGLITCLATSAASNMMVTGHESGEIVVWHNFNTWLDRNKDAIMRNSGMKLFGQVDNKSEAIISVAEDFILPVCTVLHWHAHAVNTLCLSADGRCAYSGGEEGVFVKWYTAPDAQGKNAFIPRLGDSVSHIRAR
jgi:hypothetical protein